MDVWIFVGSNADDTRVSEVSHSIRGRKLSVLGASSGAQIGHLGLQAWSRVVEECLEDLN